MKQDNENNPVALVIFGVTGDLTRRKLIPALYQLCKDDQLPAPLHVIGFARRPWSDEKLREELTAGIMQFARTKPVDSASVENLLKNATYIQSDFQNPDGYNRLLSFLEEKKLSKGDLLPGHTARMLMLRSSRTCRFASVMPNKSNGCA